MLNSRRTIPKPSKKQVIFIKLLILNAFIFLLVNILCFFGASVDLARRRNTAATTHKTSTGPITTTTQSPRFGPPSPIVSGADA